MIRYALQCEDGHPFEGWFSSSDDYDAQSARGLVTCPVCGLSQVRKQIMAPSVVGAREERAPVPAAVELVERLRAHIEAHCEDVGDAFAEEARAIHEGRAEARGIYGEASPDEVRDLIEEGVAVAPLPGGPRPRRRLNS